MIDNTTLIDILRKKENFLEIIKEFPDAYVPIVRIRQNISKEIVEESIGQILDKIKTEDKFKELILSKLNVKNKNELETVQQQSENNVAGIVITIDKNDESYTKLIKQSIEEKWSYKGIAIVDDFNKLRLYFY